MKKQVLSALVVLATSLGIAQTGSISIVSIPDQIEVGATVDLEFTYTSNVVVNFSAQLFRTNESLLTPDYNTYQTAATVQNLPADTNATVIVSFKVPSTVVATALLTNRQYTFDLKLTDVVASQDFGYSNGTADHTVEIVPSSVPVDNIDFTSSTPASIAVGSTLSFDFAYTLGDSANVKAGLAIYDASGAYLRNATVNNTEVAQYFSYLAMTTPTPVAQTASIDIPAGLTPSAQLAEGEFYYVVVSIFTTKWEYKVDKKNNIVIEDAPSNISDDVVAAFTNEDITVYNLQGAVVASGKVDEISLANGFYIFKSATKIQKVLMK